MKVSRSSLQGFTLLEMLVTFSVLLVVIGIGLPSLRDTIARNNVAAEANRLAASINFARSEAVAKGQVVTVARSGFISRDWTQGWVVFTDVGGEGNQAFNTADGDIALQNVTTKDIQMAIRSNAPAASWISFHPSGRIIANGGAAVIALCDSDTSTVIPGKQITISTVGRPTVTTIAAAQKAALCTP